MLEPPRRRRDFTIAIICALEIEADAVLDAFDANWSDQGHRYGRTPADDNTYTLGAIGEHNVVLVHMPGMGATNASTVANNLRHSFPSITVALVVGICGGVPQGPHHQKDIYLGDLIISTAVVQYDYGRQYPGGFERKKSVEDTIGGPNRKIRGLLAKVKTQHYSKSIAEGIAVNLGSVRVRKPSSLHSNSERDPLYEATYLHKHRSIDGIITCSICASSQDSICALAVEKDCTSLQCSDTYLINRRHAPDLTRPPEIHVGKIGSGNSVMKSGQHRDLISRADGIIAFEMEGAGVWESFPTIVVKSVCDYADSHKNKVWQKYAAAVAAVGTKVLLQQLEPEHASMDIPDAPLVKTAGPSGHWLVPFVRDPGYVHRTNLIDQIDAHFSDTTYGPRVALVGLGGVGKSQIAIEYAYRIKERSKDVSVFWVHASNLSRFKASYQNIARLLQITGHDDPMVDQVNLVYEWLQSEKSGRWLLIMDNVDDMSLLQPSHSQPDQNESIIRYLPQRSHAAILITSRDFQVAASLAGSYNHTISVGVMLRHEAQELVRHKITADRGRDDEVTALCAMLEFLPLAITQATAYIARSQSMTVAKYMSIFESDYEGSMRLLSEERVDFRRDWQNAHSVIRTWEISFVQMQSRNKLTTEILSLMAVFDRQAVPKFLLQRGEDDFAFNEAIDTLLGYAFVTADAGEACLSTHRLLHLAIRAWLDSKQTWTYWQREALYAIGQAYTVEDTDSDGWDAYRAIEPHAETALQSSYANDDCDLQLASVLETRSWYHRAQRHFDTAVKLRRKTVNIRSRILGEEHCSTLTSVIGLARALTHIGEGEQAERMAREALAILERVRSTASDIREARHVLGIILSLRGMYHEAEQMIRAVFESCKRSYGLNNLETLDSMSDLAVAKVHIGQLLEAEELYRDVLRLRKINFGPNHLHFVYSQENLARLFARTHRYGEALEGFELARAGFATLMGSDHPRTKRCEYEIDKLRKRLNDNDGQSAYEQQ